MRVTGRGEEIALKLCVTGREGRAAPVCNREGEGAALAPCVIGRGGGHADAVAAGRVWLAGRTTVKWHV